MIRLGCRCEPVSGSFADIRRVHGLTLRVLLLTQGDDGDAVKYESKRERAEQMKEEERTTEEEKEELFEERSSDRIAI